MQNRRIMKITNETQKEKNRMIFAVSSTSLNKILLTHTHSNSSRSNGTVANEHLSEKRERKKTITDH